MYKIYQVEYGDTLESIANMVGSTIDELVTINGFNGKELIMGDLIIVPNQNNKNDAFIRYKIQTGDTLYMIANNYNVDSNLLALLNGLDKNDYIYPNQEIIIPKDNVDIYITKDGDTIKTLLDNFNTTLDKLEMDSNNIYLKDNQLVIHKKDIY